MYYSRTLPSAVSALDPALSFADSAADAAAVAADSSLNLTISTIESNAFLLFLDGEFVGSANDHTKGPNHLTLTIPVPAAAISKAKTLLLLSAGTCVPLACIFSFRSEVRS
jgi:hypothetical protein